MLTTIFLAGAVLAAFSVLVVSLMSGRAITLRDRAKYAARFGIFVACVVSAARVMQTGTEVTWERALLMLALAVLYAAQIRCEADRQQGLTRQ